MKLKCIYCGLEAEYLVDGHSVCIKHLKRLKNYVPSSKEFEEYCDKNN